MDVLNQNFAINLANNPLLTPALAQSFAANQTLHDYVRNVANASSMFVSSLITFSLMNSTNLPGLNPTVVPPIVSSSFANPTVTAPPQNEPMAVDQHESLQPPTGTNSSAQPPISTPPAYPQVASASVVKQPTSSVVNQSNLPVGQPTDTANHNEEALKLDGESNKPTDHPTGTNTVTEESTE